MSGRLPKILLSYGEQESDCISRASRTFPRRTTGPSRHALRDRWLSFKSRGSFVLYIRTKEPRDGGWAGPAGSVVPLSCYGGQRNHGSLSSLGVHPEAIVGGCRSSPGECSAVWYLILCAGGH